MNVSNQKVLRDQPVLNCREVSRIVSSGELEQLGFVKKLRIRFHLLICRECRRYAEQIRVIGAVARVRVLSMAGDEATFARLEKSILDGAFGASTEKS